MKKVVQFTIILIFVAFNVMAQKSETRTLSSFNSIHNSGSINVILQKGNTEKADLTVSGTDISNVVTEVSDGKLSIRMKKGNYRNLSITVKVYFKNINSFRSSGSGNTKAVSTLKSDNLEVKLTGSGNFDGKVEANNLALTISGSANMNVSGEADNQSIKISGSGNVKVENLKTQNTEVKISGSGNAKVWTTESIDAKVSGSGDIRYKGNPSKIISKSTGSGSIRKL